MGLVPSPGKQPLLDNSTCFVVFSYQRNYTESDCQDGRKIGPMPTVTDERYGEESFVVGFSIERSDAFH